MHGQTLHLKLLISRLELSNMAMIEIMDFRFTNKILVLPNSLIRKIAIGLPPSKCYVARPFEWLSSTLFFIE